MTAMAGLMMLDVPPVPMNEHRCLMFCFCFMQERCPSVCADGRRHSRVRQGDRSVQKHTWWSALWTALGTGLWRQSACAVGPQWVHHQPGSRWQYWALHCHVTLVLRALHVAILHQTVLPMHLAAMAAAAVTRNKESVGRCEAIIPDCHLWSFSADQTFQRQVQGLTSQSRALHMTIRLRWLEGAVCAADAL